MYNRYTPQSDGSYRKDRMQETQLHRPPPPTPRESSYPPPEAASYAPQPEAPPCAPPPETYPKKEGIWGFLRQLLPKDFDTGDLLIILLLLLMAGDREEDRNNALLTLALYIFM